ncbi:MAG TPA: sigma 54-interacting transcriptional regulator [Polyangiaceae bacterium]
MKSHEPSQRSNIANGLDENEALRRVAAGTASETGERFFHSLVDNLRSALGTMGAWVATIDDARTALCAVSMRMQDEWLDGYIYPIAGTPCEVALSERRAVHVPDRIVDLYHGVPGHDRFGAVSYLGVPVFDSEARIIGHVAVLDDKPMPEEPRSMAIFQIFANRAGAELQRVRAERAAAEREAQLQLLVDNAMDAIVDFDSEFRVALMNPAARRVFGYEGLQPLSFDVRDLLTKQARARLAACAKELSGPGAGQSLWVAGGLDAVSRDGSTFQAEATLSHYLREHRHQFTLILRNVEERLMAEQRIIALTREARYLNDELKSLQSFERIVGSSSALLRALRALEQVAATDTTLLLLGETGTGKELFARAAHAASKRSQRPLIRLNCGAIPHNLIESELFGHEKGAFTGATQRREGRFLLADGGTLFLDEIGELPLELQPKLLRVLQEGELEPVGSSRVTRVDVRIIAATNRNLAELVAQGRFREDLFYRLNVFPVIIPALRERAADIEELARVFLDKYARRLGRSFAPFSEPTLRKLRAYSWPGNVRELQNVIERGVLVSTSGVFDIDLALPEAAEKAALTEVREPDGERVLSMAELLQIERKNFERALAQAGGKVSGTNGAAARLGINPSTLSSRLRALGLRSR